MAHTPPNSPLQLPKMAQDQTQRHNSRLPVRMRVQTHTEAPTRIPPTDNSYQHTDKHVRQNTHLTQLAAREQTSIHIHPCPSHTITKEYVILLHRNKNFVSRRIGEIGRIVSFSVIQAFHTLAGRDFQRTPFSRVHPSQRQGTRQWRRSCTSAFSPCSAGKDRTGRLEA